MFAGVWHFVCGVQVLESTEGGRSGTLMAALDHCSTPAGQLVPCGAICNTCCCINNEMARD